MFERITKVEATQYLEKDMLVIKKELESMTPDELVQLFYRKGRFLIRPNGHLEGAIIRYHKHLGITVALEETPKGFEITIYGTNFYADDSTVENIHLRYKYKGDADPEDIFADLEELYERCAR